MRRVFRIVGGAVLGSVLGFLIFYLSFPTREAFFVVPDLRGEDCERAIETLRSSGIRVSVEGTGTVLGVHPEPGMKVLNNREIKLFCGERISRDSVLKEIVGASLNFAKSLLKELGYEIGITWIDLNGQTGRVVAYRIDGKKVWILVDRGKREFFRIPDLIGDSLEETIERLEFEGIPYTVVGDGTVVVDQFPKPGSISTSVELVTE